MSKQIRQIAPVTNVPVRVQLPIHIFKQLNKAAKERNMEVGQLVGVLAQHSLSQAPVEVGKRLAYTSQTGREMLRSRELGRSHSEVAGEFGLSPQTVSRWLRRAEAECRERALRDVS